jgi:hypothetical protein
MGRDKELHAQNIKKTGSNFYSEAQEGRAHVLRRLSRITTAGQELKYWSPAKNLDSTHN